MQHSKSGDWIICVMLRARKVLANKAGTKLWPFSICSWNANSAVSTPLSPFRNKTWPRTTSSKAKTRLRPQFGYEDSKTALLSSNAPHLENKLHSMIRGHSLVSLPFSRMLFLIPRVSDIHNLKPWLKKGKTWTLYRRRLLQSSNTPRELAQNNCA